MPLTKKILILGDSISAAYGMTIDDGWAYLIQQKIDQLSLPFSLINQSINGETSNGGLARISPLLQKHKPTLVILELGANDALHGTPPEVIKDNLHELISRCQKLGAQVLLLALQTSNNYGDTYRSHFYQNYTALADEMNCLLAPDILSGLNKKEEFLQADDLHPTSAAQPFIAKRVWHYLLPFIKSIK